MIIAAAALALLAGSCKPDLAAGKVDINWNNSEQSASFVLENKGNLSAAAFDIHIILTEAGASGPGVVCAVRSGGLAAGEKLDIRNLSLRHLLGEENDCGRRIAGAAIVVDPRNEVPESDESNNRQAVNLFPISVPCEEMARFENLDAQIEYAPVSHIASGGVRFAIEALGPEGGAATVRRNLSVGHGQLLCLNNVWLQPKLHTPVRYIAFDAAAAGWPVFLEINGDAGPGPLNGAAAVDGATIGGVSVSVSGDGAAPGSWCFEGEIYSFKVGGRELAVDNMVFWPPQTKNYETSNRSFIRANRP